MYGLIDTDVLYKLSIYDLFSTLIQTPPPHMGYPAILAATQFVAAKKVQKKLPDSSEKILSSLRTVLGQIVVLEPTQKETELAEALERAAAKLNLNLDSGESQLCALTLCRNLNGIFTGDKRAIIAIEQLNTMEPINGGLKEKVTGLEQILLWMTDGKSILDIRRTICEYRGTDRSLENCFSCTANGFSADSAKAGLFSYIQNLSQAAPNVISNFP